MNIFIKTLDAEFTVKYVDSVRKKLHNYIVITDCKKLTYKLFFNKELTRDVYYKSIVKNKDEKLHTIYCTSLEIEA